jgi:hypothetical protein
MSVAFTEWSGLHVVARDTQIAVRITHICSDPIDELSELCCGLKGARMTLTTEEMGDVPDVDAAMFDEVLSYDAFGKFAILSKSDEEFIHAGCDWRPDNATKAFLAATGSDPWMLAYREGGRQLSARVM